MKLLYFIFAAGFGALAAIGCCHHKVTAVALSPWNRGEPDGIPFYLPKPILIVAKNFRNIEEAKVGLTDSAPIPNAFDDQSKYGDLNARTSFVPTLGTNNVVGPPAPGEVAQAPVQGDDAVGPRALGGAAAVVPAVGVGLPAAPGASPARIHSAQGAPITPYIAPPDGLTPDTFYTYQIVFIPDMTQKYGLRIKGGAGEIRAAMNLVNGWQFTGLGPYYMKDSSSAQNCLAGGIAANLALSGVSDVVASVAGLRQGGGRRGGARDLGVDKVREVVERVEYYGPRQPPMRLEGFAEIHIYEPHVTCDGRMEWTPITDMKFYRDFLGTSRDRRTLIADGVNQGGNGTGGLKPADPKKQQGEGEGEGGERGLKKEVGRRDGQTGVPVGAGSPGVNQVNINQYPAPYCAKQGGVLEKCLDKLCRKPRITVQEDIRDNQTNTATPLPPNMVNPPTINRPTFTTPAAPGPVNQQQFPATTQPSVE